MASAGEPHPCASVLPIAQVTLRPWRSCRTAHLGIDGKGEEANEIEARGNRLIHQVPNELRQDPGAAVDKKLTAALLSVDTETLQREENGAAGGILMIAERG